MRDQELSKSEVLEIKPLNYNLKSPVGLLYCKKCLRDGIYSYMIYNDGDDCMFCPICDNKTRRGFNL